MCGKWVAESAGSVGRLAGCVRVFFCRFDERRAPPRSKARTLGKGVRSGQRCVLWTKACTPGKGVHSGQRRALRAKVRTLDKGVHSGQRRVLWTKACAPGKGADARAAAAQNTGQHGEVQAGSPQCNQRRVNPLHGYGAMLACSLQQTEKSRNAGERNENP